MQPPPYGPQTEFLNYQEEQAWFPGQQLDVEFNSLQTCILAIEANLAIIQRDDTGLANGSVGFEQLSTTLLTALTAAGVVVPISTILTQPNTWTMLQTFAGGIATNTLNLGASGALGQAIFGNATSGTITVKPVTGALGSVTLSLPAITDTLVALTASQTLTNKTFSGNTTFPDGSVWGAGSLTMGTASVGSPGINFRSSGNAVTYDSRLIATGGNGTNGGGTLNLGGGVSIVTQASSLMTAITTLQLPHGSTGGTQLYNNLIQVGTGGSPDDANCGDSALTSYSLGLYVQHAFGGGNAHGGREAIFGNLLLLAATNASNGVRFYTAVSGQAQANASDGGTIGGGLEKGKMYGCNMLGVLSGGATGFEQCSASYDQVFMLAGSSAKTKAISQFVYGSTDAVQGSTTDAALLITAETGASAGGKIGILFSNTAGANPLATTATILAVGGSPTLLGGIDLSGATFSGGGNFAFKSTSFSVDGSGNGSFNSVTATAVISGLATLTGTSGSVSSTTTIFNPSGTFTATLPAATNGRILFVKLIANQAVNSASSNVVPLIGGGASTGILTGTAGKWAVLEGDGSNWNIIAAN